MPMYAYKCNDCEHTYEKRKKFSDPHETICPECEGAVRRLITQVGVVFKGSGFYVTDNRSGGKSSRSGSSNGKSEVKEGASEKGSAEKSTTTPAPAKAPAASSE